MLVALRMRLGWLSKKEKSSVANVENALVGERFCVNCRHYRLEINSSPKFGQCMHPSAIKTKGKNTDDEIIDHFVTGKPLPPVSDDYYYCANMRNDSFQCKREGRLWEPKA